jgi:hypothetical protein
MGVVMHLRKAQVEGQEGPMYTLKIEHPIIDFETWKAAFERDPVGRQRGGVRRYRVCRPPDDPKYVIIDLDFDEQGQARAFLEALQSVWRRADLSPGLSRENGPAAVAPRARIVEEVETRHY